jgi:hypothetical protein
MIARGIRDYVDRDWAAVRDAKDAYWAERIERLGPAEGFRIAEELRLQARLVNPEWPSEEDRRQDLLAHARLRSLLDRVRLPGHR